MEQRGAKKMKKVFKPIIEDYVDAASHSKAAQYYVAIGTECWSGGREEVVVKVQMSYNGRRVGRMSPSYPVDAGDWDRVNKRVQEMLAEYSNDRRIRNSC